MRKGTDLTLVTYGTPLYTCRKSWCVTKLTKVRAIELLCNPPPFLASLLPPNLQPPNPPPSINLIDLRTIHPLPLPDIIASAKETGRVVVVHEAGRSGGVGMQIAGEIGARAFEYLEAPVGVVHGWE